MNSKKLCAIVKKYESRLIEGELIDFPLKWTLPDTRRDVDREPQVCVIGACLLEAGVPEYEVLEAGKVGTAKHIWNRFQHQLAQVGIEDQNDVTCLISANDEANCDEYGDRTDESTADRLLGYLDCGKEG